MRAGGPVLEAEGLLGRPGRGAVEPHVAAGGGAPPGLLEALHGRLVAVDHAAGQDLLPDQAVYQREPPLPRRQDPVAQRLPRERQPLLRPQVGGDAVDGHGELVLLADHVGQQLRRGGGPGQGQRGPLGPGDGAGLGAVGAGPADVLVDAVLLDDEVGRDHAHDPLDLVAHVGHRRAARGARRRLAALAEHVVHDHGLQARPVVPRAGPAAGAGAPAGGRLGLGGAGLDVVEEGELPRRGLLGAPAPHAGVRQGDLLDELVELAARLGEAPLGPGGVGREARVLRGQLLVVARQGVALRERVGQGGLERGRAGVLHAGSGVFFHAAIISQNAS